ncbi:MAG: DNA polymerase III subunit beta [Negativicutes bacterium]|jgi:DNA polymerase-3 subunit beta
MIFQCLKQDLASALMTVQKAISTKPASTPILSGIYLSAEEGNVLTIQATDYELAIVTKIKANVEQPGKTVISGKFFTEIIKKISGNSINIEMDEETKKVKISSEHAQFTLVTMPHEEFPTIKPLIGTNFIKLNSNQFKDIIRKTTFACSMDEGRPLFTGCLFEITDGIFNMVATDTHRMAIKTMDFTNLTENVKIVIPAKILNEIVRIIGNDENSEITILWQKNEISFAFEDIYIKSRLIDGQFPNYRNVVPANHTLEIKINRANLADVIERVSLLSSGLYNVMKMSCSGDNIIFSTSNPDIGRATEVISAEITGPEMEVIFNSRYILDIVKHLESDEIVMKLNGPNSAALIENPLDKDYKYVITPVRTNNM